MTSGVNGIGGNPYSYGNYGYNNQQAQASQDEQQETQVQAPEYKPVNNEEIMRFLEANNLRVVPKTTTPVELDSEAQERIAGYMARFEELMSLVEEEFGPEVAPLVMDMVMDKLMGMA